MRTALILVLCLCMLTNAATTTIDKDDFYQLLHLKRDATKQDIKKGYRKAALKWHPDKNPDNKVEAEAMFQKIAEAYEVLSDPNARANYDRYGRDGPGSGGGGGFGSGWNFGRKKGSKHKSAEDIFKQAFGGKDPFANMADFFDVFEEDFVVNDAAADDGSLAGDTTTLASELFTFFSKYRPEKANNDHVQKLISKYGNTKKKRKRLFKKLNKKYKGKVNMKLKNLLLRSSSSSSGQSKGGLFGGGSSSFSFSSTTTTTNGDGTSSFSSTSFESSGGKTIKKSVTNDGTETKAEETITEGGRTRKRKGRKRNDGNKLVDQEQRPTAQLPEL